MEGEVRWDLIRRVWWRVYNKRGMMRWDFIRRVYKKGV